MSEFKKPAAPESVVGGDGSAKRNILRRGNGGGGPARKADGATRVLDDGSVAAAWDGVALDERDPNYDSEEDSGVFTPPAHMRVRPYGEKRVGQSKMTLSAFKTRVTPIIKSFLANGDIEDAIANISAIDAPEYHYEAVKRAVNMSFDAGDRERERVSQLLSKGYSDVFSSHSIGKAFERLFELIDEIEKDVVTAREMLAIFLARAVVDEIVPPSWLNDAVVSNLGGDIIDHAKRMLSRDLPRLDRVWGPGDGRPVEDMKVAIDQLLGEYLLSTDQEEAARCIKQLNAPLFYHEVVKRSVVQVMDKPKEAQEAMVQLLCFLVERDLLTKQQAVKGFTRLHDLLPDLLLDAPDAARVLAFVTNQAVVEGVLPENFSPRRE